MGYILRAPCVYGGLGVALGLVPFMKGCALSMYILVSFGLYLPASRVSPINLIKLMKDQAASLS